MICSLPQLGEKAISVSHFPTEAQAFIFRACEYVPTELIAKVLKTSKETVEKAISDMGLPDYAPNNTWLKKGYITIIRRLWHILPYSQLLSLLGMDESEFSAILREEDFLDIKLGKKPICKEVVWRDLDEKEKEETKEIKRIVEKINLKGKAPFEFEYNPPKIDKNGKEIFKTRMIYAFSGLYQRAFDIESEEYLPDEQIKAYSDIGVNGIWTQGVLSRLTEFPFDRSLSEGYEKRLERMRRLTERLDKYGIKLYLYINEPRSMPLEFFENNPDIKGHVKGENACLCISTEKVKNYLSNAIEQICREVPKIGGFFMITRSENLTNCYSHAGGAWKTQCTCPICKDRNPADVIAETVTSVYEGARRVSDDIRVFAWSWQWQNLSADIIRQLPKKVVLLSQSELDVPYCIGGVKGNVIDYSMSIQGPGDFAKNEWKIAKECGLEIGAKVQVNTTWEASTTPEIPVLPTVSEHIEKLKNEGVEHLLLSWTLGGYPGINLAEVARHFYENKSENHAYSQAEKEFSRAFSEFPFCIQTLYLGPQNAGPSTMLYEEDSGYKATMTCYSYDDLDGWRASYPADVYESQFEKLCTGWERGLSLLTDSDADELKVMANATYCLFKSSLNQIKFIRARREKRFSYAIEMAKEEIKIAEKMLSLMNENAAIGFEAANHYYFSKGQLAEKIVNCHHVIKALKAKLN